MDGIINVYKETGMTSHDVVAKVRKMFSTRRVGHAGTLDPLAQGVLPVLVGKATVAQEYLTNHDKIYRAGLRFGVSTSTGDITGEILETSQNIPSEEELLFACESFTGDIMQTPPMYSAIKIDGQKLYELARKGIEVERTARKITIHSITLVKRENDTDYLLDVHCSKGTYIRTLCEDIGKALGCPSTMYSLTRLQSGKYKSTDAVKISELWELHEKNLTDMLKKYVTPVEQVFSDYPKVCLSPFYSKLSKNGAEIYIKRAQIKEALFKEQKMCRMYDENNMFYAIGELMDFPEGKAVKARARFD